LRFTVLRLRFTFVFWPTGLANTPGGLNVDRKPVKQQNLSEDSLEDDDDGDDDGMNGFIDDSSDVERADYSHYIRELFGYDRRKSVVTFFAAVCNFCTNFNMLFFHYQHTMIAHLCCIVHCTYCDTFRLVLFGQCYHSSLRSVFNCTG